MEIIQLNGTWECRGRDEHGKPLYVKGAVPGCVHTDLIRSGHIDYDIFWRDNAARCRWIEDAEFTYARDFVLEQLPVNATLVFEGLDTYCDVFVNGTLVGHADDMFVRYEFPVDGTLRVGANRIEVAFRSPMFTKALPPRFAAFTAERIYTRRMQCTYGWDWVARFVTMGIYRDVYLRCGTAPTVCDGYVYTKTADAHSACVQVELALANLSSDTAVSVAVYAPAGDTVYSHAFCGTTETLAFCMELVNPQLWYPHGYGEQPLYRMAVYLDGAPAWDSTFGIVASEIVCAQDSDDSPYAALCRALQQTESGREYDHNETFSGFELYVNGVGVMCKGANWVPCEPFPSAETAEKITEILEKAKAAHVNMIRVWGGGIVEQDHFYNECDRLGILVTQDFMMACGHYPEEDETFLEALRAEARCAALRLRNHPCLMWWTGDNENAANGSDTQESFPGKIAAQDAIAPVLNRYDPARPFLLSSPYGGDVYASKTVGTTHNTQFLGGMLPRLDGVSDYKEYLKEFTARFIAEEPSFGAAERRSLRRFMTEEDIQNGRDMWLEHTKTNPALPCELFDYAAAFAETAFGAFTDGEDRLFKLQYLQYEWVRVSLELARRNRGFCNGIVYWMLNDCWPAAAGWALLDYYTYPKAAYYAFKRAAADVSVSVDGGRVYVCNDTQCRYTAPLAVKAVDLSNGTVRDIVCCDVTAPASSSAVVYETDVTQNEVLIADFAGNRAFYAAGNRPLTPTAAPIVTVLSDTEIAVRAGMYTHVVRLEGDCEFEDNYFTLLPNEECRIAVVGSIDNIVATGYTIQ